MRPHPRLLATSGATVKGIRDISLLPPIPLYRRLLRAHRKHLPSEMRLLGDEYIKKEFRLHRDIDNPAHIIGFLTEWQSYAQKLEGDSWRGDVMDPQKIAKMSDQQLGQLYELMKTIQNPEYESEGSHGSESEASAVNDSNNTSGNKQ